MFDNHQLAQILVNLINNGLRFSSKTQPHAFVTLQVYEFGKSIYIDVIDTGHGVAKENIQYLFNPFLPPIIRARVWGFICLRPLSSELCQSRIQMCRVRANLFSDYLSNQNVTVRLKYLCKTKILIEFLAKAFILQ